jgi:hypothetical protein
MSSYHVGLLAHKPCAARSGGDDTPAILRPFIRAEVISVVDAARIANRAVRTIREWVGKYKIGRVIPADGRLLSVSVVALTMVLDDDFAALELYLRGDRHSHAVTQYYDRLGIPVPRVRAVDV